MVKQLTEKQKKNLPAALKKAIKEKRAKAPEKKKAPAKPKEEPKKDKRKIKSVKMLNKYPEISGKKYSKVSGESFIELKKQEKAAEEYRQREMKKLRENKKKMEDPVIKLRLQSLKKELHPFTFEVLKGEMYYYGKSLKEAYDYAIRMA